MSGELLLHDLQFGWIVATFRAVVVSHIVAQTVRVMMSKNGSLNPPLLPRPTFVCPLPAKTFVCPSRSHPCPGRDWWPLFFSHSRSSLLLNESLGLGIFADLGDVSTTEGIPTNRMGNRILRIRKQLRTIPRQSTHQALESSPWLLHLFSSIIRDITNKIY